jgi:predicted secreted acid phosphatase
LLLSSQPANIGDAKIGASAYHDSGAYDRDLATVGNAAVRWLKNVADSIARPALVLDIDETSLSNWEIVKRDDFGRPLLSLHGSCAPVSDAPCSWPEWEQLGRDPAIGSTLEVFRQARALNIAVFFITGRSESLRAATERNLNAVGYKGYEKLYMVPIGAHFVSSADYKAPIRAKIEQAGYKIVANMGDQPSDLKGGHAEKKFLLPNPFYRIP